MAVGFEVQTWTGNVPNKTTAVLSTEPEYLTMQPHITVYFHADLHLQFKATLSRFPRRFTPSNSPEERRISWFSQHATWPVRHILLHLIFPTQSQPPTQWLMESLFPRVNRPQREAEHSSVSSAAVENEWSYTSPPSYASMLCTQTTKFEICALLGHYSTNGSN